MPKYDSMRKVDMSELIEFIKAHRHYPPHLGDWGLREIGDNFGISAQRVWEVEKKYVKGEK